MKSCKYCNTRLDDDVLTCPQCGGNDFNTICNNCGSVFDAPFCPNCGVKAGRKPMTCPECGMKTYTHHCPNCGYDLLKNDEARKVIEKEDKQKTEMEKLAAEYEGQTIRSKNGIFALILTIFLPFIGGLIITCDDQYKRWTQALAGIYCIPATILVFIFFGDGSQVLRWVLTIATAFPAFLWLSGRSDADENDAKILEAQRQAKAVDQAIKDDIEKEDAI